MIKNKDLVNFSHGGDQNDFGEFQQLAKISYKGLKILTLDYSMLKIISLKINGSDSF